jgi:1,4-alpha-glucan branching enzyme
MVRKNYSKSGRVCRVTFDLVPQGIVSRVTLCGEFNDWDPAAHPMRERKDGRFSTTVSLQSGRIYRFKYLVEAKYWENDSAADAYIQNAFGTEDSIVKV